MGVAVGISQAARRDMRVDLRRREVLMAQQFLDDTEVRPTVQQVRGERVAEGVRRDTFRQSGRPTQAVQAAVAL